MDWTGRVFLDRFKRTLSNAIPQVSPNPVLRRRLYGTLAGVLALAIGSASSQMIRDQAIESWIESHPPTADFWEIAAKRSGLSAVIDPGARQAWNSKAPQDWSKNTAWWDAQAQALWVVAPRIGNSEDNSTFTLFTRDRLPPKTAADRTPARGLRLLGRGWDALREFEALPLLGPVERNLRPARRVRTPVNHPKEWIF